MGFKIIDLNNIIFFINKILNKDLKNLDFFELGEQEFKITFEESDNLEDKNLKVSLSTSFNNR